MFHEVGESMFSTLGKLAGQPDPQDLAAEIAKQFKRDHSPTATKLAELRVETYDLSDAVQALAYSKDLASLMAGVPVGTHALLMKDVQFVSQGTPRWVAHLQWVRFEIKEIPGAAHVPPDDQAG